MKRRTNPTLQVQHPLDMSLVKTVDFLFKHTARENARQILVKHYPGEVTEENGIFSIPFTQEETALFSGDCQAYCDPRVVLESGVIPATAVCSFPVQDTLWGENDD